MLCVLKQEVFINFYNFGDYSMMTLSIARKYTPKQLTFLEIFMDKSVGNIVFFDKKKKKEMLLGLDTNHMSYVYSLLEPFIKNKDITRMKREEYMVNPALICQGNVRGRNRLIKMYEEL